jgi:hypothetical protein
MRERFVRSPQQLADELDLIGQARTLFLAIDAHELSRQAVTLIDKRYHEVCDLLPGTIAGLYNHARPAFGQYAETIWPDGHRRHHLDAVAFCRWLESHDLPFEPMERNCSAFAAQAAALRAHVITRINGMRCFGAQLLIRWRGRRYRHHLFIVWPFGKALFRAAARFSK